jgi:hypothetical protein
VRKDNTHRARVEDTLDKAITTLIWDTYEWGDAREQGSGAQGACIGLGEDGVLELNKHSVVAIGLSQLNHCWRRAQPDSECLESS